MVRDIHHAMISDVDGQPGLVERVRVLEQFKSRIDRLSGTIAVAGIGSILTLIVNLVLLWMKSKGV